ncbi:unnamed protein product [Nesidiocoris tenuis]|uniref:Uncharacterized protein n=1 Tax=Nesidiocoris tenuis TaxID=355587 RepID=A0A6H5G7R8_9HEMI|nr:unnamed protein product [Nesidiocoris tenuis]
MVKLPRRLNQPVKKEMEKRQHRSMYFHCLLVLLLASGSLGADLRRPRQQPAEQGASGGSQGQGGSIPGISNFQPIFQQFQNPNPQEFITNPGNQISQFGNQIPGGSQFTNQIPGGFNPQSFIPGGQQQQQQQQQQQPSLDFSNRNPPAQAQEPIPIISYENVQPGDGTYRFSYETGDGIKREESGEQKVVGEPPEAGTIAKGSYSYTDIDGNQIAVSYIADENGFQDLTSQRLHQSPRKSWRRSNSRRPRRRLKTTALSPRRTIISSEISDDTESVAERAVMVRPAQLRGRLQKWRRRSLATGSSTETISPSEKKHLLPDEFSIKKKRFIMRTVQCFRRV